MAVGLAFAARSDIGLTRSNNQDSGYAGPHLLVVADGMGGHAGGDIASSVAIAHLAPLDEETPSTDEAAEAINAAVGQAHAELLDRVAETPELAGLGTTITALLRCEDRLVLAHIGDSRAYLLRDGNLEQVTVDHTFVQYLVESGKLEPDQAERHPQRSLLLRVLGDVDLGGGLDISVRSIQAGDRWLVCSDGLSSVVSAETISEALTDQADAAAAAERLIDLALRAGGPDNVTCVIADVVDLDQLPDGTAPPTASQIVGAAAIDGDRPTRGGSGAAGKAARLAAPNRTEPTTTKRRRRKGDSDQDDPAVGELVDLRRRAPLGRRLILAFISLLLLAGAGLGLKFGYDWSQTQYYVGQADGRVAIYQGINQALGPWKLSHLVELTTTEVSTLPDAAQARLRETISAGSRQQAAQELATFLANSADLTPTKAGH